MDASSAVAQTRLWLEKMVIGYHLCPFAAPVLANNTLLIHCCESQSDELMLAAVARELEALQSSHETEMATSLLVFSQGLKDFYRFLEFADLAQQLLEDLNLEGHLQIATFHPDYFFDGEPPDDASHFTNRSPYPTLHFIREAQLARALETYPHPEQIPARNIRKMNQLGVEHLKQLLAEIQGVAGQ